MNIRRNQKSNSTFAKSKARIARFREKALQLKSRAKSVTLALMQRRENRIAWWQRAFKTNFLVSPVFSRVSSLWVAFVELLHLASRSIFGRSNSLPLSKRDRVRVFMHESLELRKLMANDLVVAPTSIFTTEAGGTATFTVALSDAPSAVVAVTVDSSDTTEGIDNVASSLVFTPSNWSTPQTVTVTGVDDLIDDDNVAYSINLLALSTDPNYQAKTAAVSATNNDNDTAGISYNISSATTTEAGGTTTFTVTLTSEPTAAVTVFATSTSTAEGTVTPATLAFTTSNWSTPQTITVIGQNDSVDDGDITYAINLTAASTDAKYSPVSNSVSITNIDNDTAGFSVSSISGSTTEAGGTATFTVALTSQPTVDVSVNVTSNDTTEGTVAPATLTFTAGNWSVAQTVTVTGVDDNLDDGNINYSITLAGTTDGKYSSVSTSVAAVNVDNDTAGLSITQVSNTTTEAGGTATFTVKLTSQPTSPVTISLVSDDTTEGTLSTASLNFTDLNWSTPQTVTVNGVNDLLDDGDIAFSVGITSSSSDSSYNGNSGSLVFTNIDNDNSALSITGSGLTTSEGGSTASFTVQLTSQPTANVVVTVSSVDTTEGTIGTPSLTFTPSNWSVPQSVTVNGVDDFLDDNNITYQVSLTATSSDSDYNGETASLAVTNIDNDTKGLSITSIAGTVSEAGGTGTFTVRLTSEPTATVNISAVSSLTSEATVAPATLSFTSSDWSTPKTVTVYGVNEFIADGDKSFNVNLSASGGDYSGVSGSVAGINVDNDVAGITVSSSTLSTAEAGPTQSFTVALTSQPTANVSVNVSSLDTTEGTVSTSPLTFTSSNWSTPQTVVVNPRNDAIDDGNITYSISLTASSTDSKYTTASATVSVTNADDDTAGITIVRSGLTTTEAGGSASFTVALTSEPTSSVLVSLTSSDNTEGIPSPSTLTFNAANWSTPQNVVVNGVDDAFDDSDVTYSVSVVSSSSDAVYNAGFTQNLSFTNIDDDSSSFSIVRSGLTTTEAGGTASFTVKLTSEPTANVTVTVASSNSAEGSANVSVLTFTPANWLTAQNVVVTGQNEFVDDNDVTYNVTLTAASADGLYNGQSSSLAFTNTDDDVAGITVSSASVTTSEAPTTSSFTVALTSQPTANVTVNVASLDTTEGTVSPATLTFTPANWNTPQTVSVAGVDDAIDDGNITYSVTLQSTSSDSKYGSLSTSVSATNIDNDTAGLSIVQVGSTTTEAGGTAYFTVALTSQPTSNVTINVGSVDSSEGTVSVGTLAFTTSNWSTPQAVTVSGVNDDVVDGNITYSINLTASTSDAAYSPVSGSVSLTNIDNDTAGISITGLSGSTTSEAGGSASFSVKLTSEPTANVTVSVVSSNLSEGSVSPTTLTFTPANWSANQTVSVAGVDDNIQDGNISYTVSLTASSSDAIYAGKTGSVSLTNLDNDVPDLVVSAISGNTTEANGTASFTVALTTLPTDVVTVSVVSGTPSEGTVSVSSLTFTPSNWSLPQSVVVTGQDDAMDDDNVTYSIALLATSTDTQYNGQTDSVSVINVDNDTADISISVGSTTTTEANGSTTFTVVLTSQPTSSVTLTVASQDTTEGTASPSTVSFNAANWSVPQTVTVTGVDDAIDDGDQAYSVLLTAASADSKYSGQSDSVGLTNTDNDTAGITLVTSGLSTSEAGGTTSFTVALTSEPTQTVTVNVASQDTTEGTVSVSALTFTAANWSSPQTVSVAGVDDSLDDGNITYAISLNTTTSDSKYSSASQSLTLTNTDDDVSDVSITVLDATTSEASGTAYFTVQLTAQPTATVFVSVASTDSTEGSAAPASLTFTTSNWSVPQTVVVTGVDDAIDDNDIAYSVALSALSLDGQYSGQTDSVSLTNTDNDTAGISVSAVSGSTSEAGGTATFTVALTSEPTSAVTVNVLSLDSTEGSASPASVVFNASNWSSAQTIVLTGVNDAIDDGDITYSVSLTAASSDSVYAGKTASVSAVNVDNDVAGLTIVQNGTTTTEAGGSASFTVALTSQPTDVVTVTVASSNGSEGSASAATLTFNPFNWSSAQAVSVTGQDDFVDDGNISYAVSLTAASSDLEYAGKSGSVNLTNIDNDTAGLSVTVASSTTTEAGGTASFSVALTSQPTQNVTVNVSSLDLTEGTASPSTLTFTAANWSSAQPVVVTGQNDVIDDDDVNYTVALTVTTTDSGYVGKTSNVSLTNLDDADFANVSASLISGTTSESGNSANFSVVLTSQPTSNVLLFVGLDGTEGSSSASSVSFTPANWSVAQVVTITGVNDNIDDGDVTYNVVLTATSADSKYDGQTEAISVTNLDDDTAGLSITVAGTTTTEAGGTASFTVALTSEPTSNVVVTLASNDSTEGSVSVSALTFTSANWSAPQTVTVSGLDDKIDDGSVTYSVGVSTSSSDSNYTTPSSSLSFTNLDDDTAGLSISVASSSTSEAGSTASFTVQLTSEPTANVTVSITSLDLTEGTAGPGSLVFTPANWSVAQPVTVYGVDDFADDGDITYSVSVSPSSLDANYATGSTTVSVINVDNDAVGLSTSLANISTSEAGASASFTVQLTSQPSSSVVVTVTIPDSTEGSSSASSLTFTPANWSVAQSVTVSGVDDFVDDGDITHNVSLTAVSLDPQYLGVSGSVSVTNIDNDTAGLSIVGTGLSTSEAGASASFTVKLTSEPTSTVTINVASLDLSEGTSSPATLVFTPSDWSTPKTVTVTGVDDSVDDGDVSYSIGLTATTSDGLYATQSGNVSVLNIDNDTAGISVTASSITTTEAGASSMFAVVLTSQPTADVTVTVASQDTSEGSASTSTLTFNASNWNTAQQVFVTGVDDQIDDGDITYSVSLTAASSDSNYGSPAKTASVSVTNVDNDSAGLSVVGTGTTSEAGGTATFTVQLTSEPTADVTVTAVSNDSSEGTVTSTPLTFTSSNWSIPQTVTVLGVDDSVDDGDVTYGVNLTSSSADSSYSPKSASVTLTNTDNDTAGLSVSAVSGSTTEAGGTATFTVQLSTEPTANVTVTVNSLDSTEGTVAPITLNFTTANWSQAQTVTITGVDDALDDGSVSYGVSVSSSSSDSGYASQSATVSAVNVDDDTAGLSVSVNSITTTEAGGTASFAVTLTSEPTAGVVVLVSVPDSSEGSSAVSSLSFTTSNWSVPQSVIIHGNDDAVADGNILHSVSLSSLSLDANYSGKTNSVSVTNLDNDVVGLSIVSNGTTTTEAGGTSSFTVKLTSEPTANVTVSLLSNDLSEGTASVSSLVFTPSNWSTAQNVTVSGVNDPIDDGDIAYGIAVSSSSSDSGYQGLSGSVSLTNLDNDTAGLNISSVSGPTTEAGNGTATFTVSLQTEPTANVTVSIASNDATEGTVSGSVLTFTASNWSSAQTVVVFGQDDVIDDGDITYSVQVTSSSTDSNYGSLSSPVSLVNVDNDSAGLSVTQIGSTTTESGGTASFTVKLTSMPSNTVTVSLVSSDTTEGNVSPSSFVFTPANWSVPQTANVAGVNDAIDDGNVNYNVSLQAFSLDPQYLGPNTSLNYTNVDDDTADLLVTPSSGQTTEAGATASFTVALKSEPTSNVVVNVASSDLTEGTVSASTLTFTPSNWSTPQSVTVYGADDIIADGNIAYSVNLNASSSDGLYNGQSDSVALVNVDNDSPGLIVTVLDGTSSESGGTASFNVSLTVPPTQNVLVSMASGDTTEGTVLTPPLLFTTSNWSVPQAVTVQGVNDAIDDGDITFAVNLTALSLDSQYQGLTNSASVTNVDDDTAGLSVSVISGSTSEAGSTATFTVKLTSEPTSAVTVSLSNGDTTEGSLSAASLNFTAANWSTPQTIVVTGVNDELDDGDISYSISASATSSDPLYQGPSGSVSVTNVDDDTTPVANDDSFSINEDSSLSVGAPGVVNDDTDADGDTKNAVLVSPPLNAASFTFNANGSFNFQPVANFFGTVSFTYKLVDDGGNESNVAQVVITVNALNDAPTDIALSNNVVNENSSTVAALAVGNLSSTDIDSSSFTYSVLPGLDGSDFQIDSGVLKFKAGTVLDYETKSSYQVSVRTNDGAGGTFDETLTVNIQNLAELVSSSWLINGGQTQRSSVTTISFSFDGAVTLGSGAFVLRNRLDNSLVNLDVQIVGPDVSIGFLPGSNVISRVSLPNSLADGNYELIMDGSAITLGGLGADLDLNGLAGGTYTYGDSVTETDLFRLFGDIDGDRDVDALNFAFGRLSLNTIQGDLQYRAELDRDGDLDVDALDFAFLRLNLNKILNF